MLEHGKFHLLHWDPSTNTDTLLSSNMHLDERRKLFSQTWFPRLRSDPKDDCHKLDIDLATARALIARVDVGFPTSECSAACLTEPIQKLQTEATAWSRKHPPAAGSEEQGAAAPDGQTGRWVREHLAKVKSRVGAKSQQRTGSGSSTHEPTNEEDLAEELRTNPSLHDLPVAVLTHSTSTPAFEPRSLSARECLLLTPSFSSPSFQHFAAARGPSFIPPIPEAPPSPMLDNPGEVHPGRLQEES